MKHTLFVFRLFDTEFVVSCFTLKLFGLCVFFSIYFLSFFFPHCCDFLPRLHVFSPAGFVYNILFHFFTCKKVSGRKSLQRVKQPYFIQEVVGLLCFISCSADEAAVHFLKMINLHGASLATTEHMMVFLNQTHLIFHACHTYVGPINSDFHSQIVIIDVQTLKPDSRWLSLEGTSL